MGLARFLECRAAVTQPVTLSGTPIIDGVQFAIGNEVLVVGQFLVTFGEPSFLYGELTVVLRADCLAEISGCRDHGHQNQGRDTGLHPSSMAASKPQRSFRPRFLAGRLWLVAEKSLHVVSKCSSAGIAVVRHRRHGFQTDRL